MINKNQFRVDSDKKVLHKIGKRWVTVSVAMLALLGGSLVMSHKTTHADATTPSAKAQNTNNTKKVLNQSLQKNYDMNVQQKPTVASAKPVQPSSASAQSAKPSAIQSSAKAMYGNIVRNAAKPSAKSDAMNTLNLGTPSEQAKRWNFVQHGINNNDYARVNQPKSSVVNNSASNDRTTSVSSARAKASTAPSNSVSAPAKPSFNSAYQSYMAQMSSVDSEVAKDNAGNVQSNTKNKKKPLIKDSNDDSQYFSGGVKDTGSVDGLNYTAYTVGGVEFTDGIAQSNFSPKSNRDVDNASAIKFDSDVDISKVTTFRYMFSSIGMLSVLDLGSNFNTSNATDMSEMFYNDSNLLSLNLGNEFDTSNVTNMSDMFDNDSNLLSLNLGNKFDTSKVTNMNEMFNGDSSLQSLNLGDKFNTSNVTNMNEMFSSNNSLPSLNLGNKFDTSKVTSMGDMFNGDSSLQSLNLGDKFNTSNVTNMNTSYSGIFYNDNALQSLTIDSPLTKIDNINLPNTSSNNTFYKQLPEKDPQGKNYTLSTPNDFSQGNVGTFVNCSNPAPSSDNATVSFKDNNGNLIPFKYNNQTVTSATLPKQKFATPINLNNLLPTNYELVNPSQSVVADGDTHAVSVKLNYDEVINSLVNEASSESAAINGDNKELNSDNNTIASYKASSASISNAIANADDAENWVKSYSASVSNAYNSANDADNWVHSNSSSAQNADSWVANNSSNAAHASNQATTNSSAINSLNGRTSNDETSLSNNIAKASTIASEASAQANTDSNSITSLSTSANANHSADNHNIVSLSTSANSQAKSYAGSLSASVASASTAINSALSNANSNASSLNTATSTSASNAIASASASASNSVSSADNSINASLSNVKSSASASASSAYSSAVSYANSEYATESGARSSAVSSLNTSIASASARALSSANSAYSAASITASQDGSKAYSSASSLVNSASSAASSSVSSALTSATTYASNSIGSLQSSASNKAASYANSLSGQINSLSGSTNAKVTSLSSGVSSNSTAIASNSTAETSLINSLQSSASNAIASADTKATSANGTATKNFNSSMNSLQSSLASETNSASASASSAYSNAVSYANNSFATQTTVNSVKSSLSASIANASARALASANSAYNAGASVANANYGSATSLINSASAKASSSVSSALSSATTYVSNSISSLSGSTSADSATLNSKINSASTNDSNAASASASSAYSNASSYANSLRTSASGSITIVLNSLNSHINNSYASAIASINSLSGSTKADAVNIASASASSAYSNAVSYANSLNKTANGSINNTIDKLNRSIATNSAAISGNAKNISNNTNEINHLKSDGSITLAFSVGDDVIGGKNGTYITLDDNEVRSQPKYNNSSDTYVITNLLKDDIPSGYHINGNVYAKVKSLNDGFAQIQLLGNAPQKLNTVSLTRELTKPANVQQPRHQLGVARPIIKLGGFRSVGAEQSQDHVIPLVGNGVTYKGTVTLKYNANGKTVKTIQEPYKVTTEVGNQVTLLNPNDYINKTMNGFDTHNYNPSDTNDYQTFTVDPNAAPSDTNPTYSKDYTLNFNAQGIKDTIIYDLSSANTPAGYQGKIGDIKTTTPSGTYDTGVASSTITNGVPANYHIVGDTPSISYDGGSHTVEVAPNMETISVSYNDTDNGGSIVGADDSKVGNQGKTYTQNINVPYDTKISDITKDVNIPSGYSYSGGNKTYVVNGNDSQSDAISIKGNQETNDVTVTINKIDGGKTATSTKMVQVSGATGTQYSINPSDKAYQPDGYGVESSTQSGTFKPNNQLSNPTMNFKYNAQQGGAITVNYINQHGAKQTETINGNTDDTGKISDKAPVPAGYNANNGQATTYHILPHTQTITIHTTGEPASAVDKTNHGKITVYINKVSGGKSINNGGTPVTVDLSGKSVGDSYTIKSSSYTPNGYTDNSNNINGTVTPNGLSTDDYTKPQMTFKYTANAGATINVKYVNQDGATVNSGQITGPVDETGSVTSAVNLPSDYTVNNGQNQTYTITTNQQNLTYHVTGKPAKATINFVNQDNDPAGSATVSGKAGDTVKPNGNQYPSGYVIPSPAPSYKFNQGGQNAPITVHITGKTASDANGSKSTNYKPTDKNDKNSTDTNAKRGYATITVVEKATNGNVLHTIIDTVNENDKRVGDSYTITPADVHPNGYDADSSDANLTGVIKSDGSLSNPTATFDYTVDVSNIEPISIAYENQNHKFIDPTSGELVADQQDATYTISAEELAKLGNAGDTVDITGYLKTPRGYHFTTAKDLIVDVNGQRLDAITLEKKQLGMARPLMLLSLWTPKPKKPAKPVKPSSAAKPKKSASAKPSSAPAAPSASSRPKLILPSDGIAPTNRARIIPSDNTSKPSSHAKRNHSGIVNGKTKNKPSKSENQPNMNEHNRRANRNKNVIPSDANVTPLVADRNAGRASYANAEPVHVNVPKPTVATTQHNNNGKLPQTNEAGNASAIAAVMMLLTGISFAGVDLDRKHSI